MIPDPQLTVQMFVAIITITIIFPKSLKEVCING
jgi:hypothetical protein